MRGLASRQAAAPAGQSAGGFRLLRRRRAGWV